MFLRSLEVRNFRGVVSGRLDLGDTTVLIGENDCGKSSLLSALAVVLASGDGEVPVIEAHHFHRPRDPAAPLQGPIRIELVFEERSAGEWSEASLGSLATLLARPVSGARRLRVTVTADVPQGAAPPVAHWEIVSPGAGKPPSADDPEPLATIRRLCPLVWLRSGMLLGATGEREAGPVGGRLAALAAEVESHYESLMTGTSLNELEELKAGYLAARELLRRRAEEHHSAGGRSQTPVSELLGARAGPRPVGQAFHGSAAQQIGVLIVTAAIIRHGLARWTVGTTPLLVVEDPEAHLHLMTLASVWGLLEHAGAQKIIGTQSETLLAAAPLHTVRRLTRTGGTMRQWRVAAGALTAEELRKLSYHVRSRRGAAMFARCWLLVEGETEFWLLPELAHLSGYDLNVEGVAAVEFAQCGLKPLIKLARQLGIEWHVLTDGDPTGRVYADEARSLAGHEADRRLTRLREPDIEHCFWRHGYAGIYLGAAGVQASGNQRISAGRVIRRAIKRHSKPFMAFEALAAVSAQGASGVPLPLRNTIETCVQLARRAPQHADTVLPPARRPARQPGHHGKGR